MRKYGMKKEDGPEQSIGIHPPLGGVTWIQQKKLRKGSQADRRRTTQGEISVTKTQGGNYLGGVQQGQL